MRLLSIVALHSFFPLLVGCLRDPADDGAADEGAADSTTQDIADDTSSTSAATDPPIDTETADTTLSATETDAETTAPETDTDGGEPLPGCECILDEGPGKSCELPTPPTCGEPLCPLVSGACPGFACSDGPFEIDDPAAIECALTALRDRTPGLLTWRYSDEAELLTEDGYVLISEQGTAARREGTRQDLSVEVSDAALGELQDAEHFDACLAESDALARFDCLREPLGARLGVCDESWWGPDCI